MIKLSPISKNKKGISEMVSYVLLVVIAVGVSVLVFSYLKVYVPKGEKPTCQADISVVLKNYTCSYVSGTSSLTLTLENKGLFTIDAVYVRFDLENKSIKRTLTSPYPWYPLAFTPGNTTNKQFQVSAIVTRPYPQALYKVEIEPAVYTGKSKKGFYGDKELALCDQDTITQTIKCTEYAPTEG